MQRNIGMKRILGIIAVLIIIGAVGLGVDRWQHSRENELNRQKNELQSRLDQAQNLLAHAPSFDYKSGQGVSIQIFVPLSKAKVSSPLNVVGMVPGNWSFEAQFPVKLKDASGTVIASAPATLTGDWQTSSPVPFTASLVFAGQPTGTGTLVIQKDNPSGLAVNDDTVAIPVEFAK